MKKLVCVILGICMIASLAACGGKTQFMMLLASEETWHTEFYSLTYDVEKTIREMEYKTVPCSI